jgi:phenylpropionate dioxygenase-like ring-hydroxylating dioxygenase large terminal subunit
MDAQTEIELGERVAAMLDANTSGPATGEYRQPVAHYIDRAHLARERDLLFRRQPLVVAAAAEFEKPGDFRTTDIDGVNALVVRQADGSLRAFHNVCRHRGTRVVDEASGCRPTFTCRFHAWVYGTDGALRHIPGAEGFTGLDRAALSLAPLPVAERHGLVWLGPIRGEAIDIDAFLGPAGAILADFGIAQGGVFRFERFPEAMNWKLVIDTFLEAYHVPHLHAKTIAPFIEGRGGVYDTFGRHGRFLTPRRTFDDVRRRPAEPGDLKRHVITVLRLFPNAVAIWNRDHVELWTAVPDGDDPDRCIVRLWLITPQRHVAGPDRAMWDKNWAITYGTVQTEDFPMARTIQQGFHSGAQSHVVFGRNERGLHDFHEALRDAMG